MAAVWLVFWVVVTILFEDVPLRDGRHVTTPKKRILPRPPPGAMVVEAETGAGAETEPTTPSPAPLSPHMTPPHLKTTCRQK